MPLLALFLLIGFAAGLAVPRLGQQRACRLRGRRHSLRQTRQLRSSPDASAAVYIAPDDAAATASPRRLEVAVPSFETVDELTETHVLLELRAARRIF